MFLPSGACTNDTTLMECLWISQEAACRKHSRGTGCNVWPARAFACCILFAVPASDKPGSACLTLQKPIPVVPDTFLLAATSHDGPSAQGPPLLGGWTSNSCLLILCEQGPAAASWRQRVRKEPAGRLVKKNKHASYHLTIWGLLTAVEAIPVYMLHDPKCNYRDFHLIQACDDSDFSLRQLRARQVGRGLR